MQSFATATIGAVLALGLVAGAQAATINGSDFTDGLSNQVIGGITWQAAGGNGTFEKKTLGTPSFTGVGVSGATGGEIDIKESITGTSATPFAISSITLGVLYDGPEFNDVNEVAQVTINLGAVVFTLTANGATTASISGIGGATVTNLSPADDVGGAVWRIAFASPIANVTSISFTALTGLPASTCPGCDNQSDYTLVQLVTVPEPASLALLGAGLLGLGLARRRRA